MAEALRSALLINWRRHSAYAMRLVGDLADEQMLGQPVPGRTLNHPAWVLTHLTLYAAVAGAMLRGEHVPDPIDHPFGMKSEPQADPAVYLPRVALIERYRVTHDGTEAALLAADPAIFSRPAPVERWRTINPTVGDMAATLLIKHEAGHLGQLSAWRRALGLPRVQF